MAVQLTESPDGPRIHIPLDLKRTSGRKQIVLRDELESSDIEHTHLTAPSNALLIAVARGFTWRRLLDESRYMSVRQMANDLGVASSYVSRLIRLSFLAPDIIEAVVEGRQPDGMSIERLRRRVPSLWNEQRQLTGVQTEPRQQSKLLFRG